MNTRRSKSSLEFNTQLREQLVQVPHRLKVLEDADDYGMAMLEAEFGREAVYPDAPKPQVEELAANLKAHVDGMATKVPAQRAQFFPAQPAEVSPLIEQQPALVSPMPESPLQPVMALESDGMQQLSLDPAEVARENARRLVSDQFPEAA